MAALVDSLAPYTTPLIDYLENLEPFGRLMWLWAFILGGVLLATQASQIGENNASMKWTKLNAQTRPYWITIYVFEGLALLSGAYPLWLWKISDFFLFFGYERQLMNGLWLVLLGVDALLVLYAALTFVSRSIAPAPKQKTQ